MVNAEIKPSFSGTFVDGGCCKDNWLPFQESCYYFGHDAVHFTEAEVKLSSRRWCNSSCTCMCRTLYTMYIQDENKETGIWDILYKHWNHCLCQLCFEICTNVKVVVSVFNFTHKVLSVFISIIPFFLFLSRGIVDSMEGIWFTLTTKLKETLSKQK